MGEVDYIVGSIKVGQADERVKETNEMCMLENIEAIYRLDEDREMEGQEEYVMKIGR